MEPRTHREVRITQQRHDNYILEGIPKKILKASEQRTGIKDSCAFSKLEYIDVVCDYQLDGMHIMQNVVALHHNALLGSGWSADVRNCARALHINEHTLKCRCMCIM